MFFAPSKPTPVLAPPKRPSMLPENAQWLAGVGAGSWFVLAKETGTTSNTVRITRYSPQGVEECTGLFTSDTPFDEGQDFLIHYPSHCAIVTVYQYDKLITFQRLVEV